jgi:medium-chain acyl-[acyl-carrier-protein] hydrolase
VALKRDPWFPYRQPKEGAALRLFCFPHAGAGASIFRDLAGGLPGVEVAAVQLPGHEARIAEPPVAEMARLSPAVADAIERLPPLPCAFFGHSLGAIVAFEATRELRRRGARRPLHLFASACPAPHIPDRDDAHTLPDAELVARLRGFGETSEEVLANRELMEMILPIYRADAALTETYAYADEPPLDLPITAIGGREDERATMADLSAWQRHTRAAFALETVPGRHLFLQTARAEVLAIVTRALGILGTG